MQRCSYPFPRLRCLRSEIAALELRVQALVDENEDLKEKSEARAAEMRAETEVESQAKQPVTATC